MHHRRRWRCEIIRRVRIDYSLSAADLLEKLKPSIRDVTQNDLERWRKAGEVQFRLIDGRIAYFGREPSNIFRFCGEAKDARGKAAERADWTLEQHLARVIAEAKRTGRRQVVPIRHRVHYSLTILPDAPGLKQGAVVRVWLPFPQEYRQQQECEAESALRLHTRHWLPVRPGSIRYPARRSARFISSRKSLISRNL